eukprot:TRINITY_DN16895_c0_g1_i1.p1 TRINITY_DN16895_c0_g1~~TRINITY_DN16895_c0_g1_i1.p1  ORF type:complete len:363 (+),score=-29.54 TRINITY_DN16895_c0_g1_i1:273-1361(+)
MNGWFSPGSPQLARLSSSSASENDTPLAELLAERKKLAPFRLILPCCSRLLEDEIARLSSLGRTSSSTDHDLSDQLSSPKSSHHLGSSPKQSHLSPFDTSPWSPLPNEIEAPNFSPLVVHPPPSALPPPPPLSSAHSLPPLPGWSPPPCAPPLPALVPPCAGLAPVVRRTYRINVPVDKFPAYNFVGRLLGPRGNSLKRVEAQTGCRVLIRGRGSIKDPCREERMRGKPGYEHLFEPLHVIVLAEMPADVLDACMRDAVDIVMELLKPVDDSHDLLKRAQLRELAVLNGRERENQIIYGTASAGAAGGAAAARGGGAGAFGADCNSGWRSAYGRSPLSPFADTASSAPSFSSFSPGIRMGCA